VPLGTQSRSSPCSGEAIADVSKTAVGAACSQRHRDLFTLLTVPGLRYPGGEPALVRATRAWLFRWPGIGRIVAAWPATATTFSSPATARKAGGRRSSQRAGGIPYVGGRIGVGAGAVDGGAAGGVGELAEAGNGESVVTSVTR
jgi:hypothetical protein